MSLDMEQITDRLIGHTEWVGETNSDDEALDNLPTLEYLTEHLVGHLVHNVEALQSQPNNYSAKKLGEKSKEILLYLKSEVERLGIDTDDSTNTQSVAN